MESESEMVNPGDSTNDPVKGPTQSTSGGSLIQDAVTAPPSPVKMVGYLEKRSKMIGWRRYWFVLDGSLLTYYRTRADYDSSLAACLGSINLGLASSVRPVIRACRGFPLQITTRTQIYYLRSTDKTVLEKWLIALQETTSVPPTISSPTWADPGVQFYRYSFAASGSQWSLSTDDISGSLRDLPRNFYLKPGERRHLAPSIMSKSQSLACLNVGPQAQPRAEAPRLGQGGGSTVVNTIDESTAVMPKSTTNAQKLAAQLRAPINEGARLRPGSLTNSPAPPPKPIRQATSMLVLANSSTKAELRRELNAKMSVGALFKRSTPNLKEIESVLGSEARDSHAYDEIIDFEANYGAGETMPISGARARASTTTTTSDSGHSGRESVGSAPSSPVPLLEGPEGGTQRAPSPKPSSSSPLELQRGGRADVTQSRIIYHVEKEPCALDQNVVGGKGKKKKGIGGFFQKMFKKDNKDKESGESQKRDRSGSTTSSRSSRRGRASDRPPVITGPVDLRAATRERANTTGSTKPVAIPKAAHVALPHPPRSPQLDNMMAELKTKVEKINAGGKKERPDLKVVIAACQPMQTPPPPPSTPRPKTPEHYENNLGKFNRLSAHLNPTFVAALNKGAFTQNNGASVITSNGNGNGGAVVHRSNTLPASGRYGQSVVKEEPPLLPPKKRRAGEPPLCPMTEALAPAYDVPQNNQPIPELMGSPTGLVDMSSIYSHHNGNGINSNGNERVLHPQNTSLTLRDLTKKHSAPDIMFQPRPIPNGEDELDILLQLNIVPPPPPRGDLEMHPMECPCQAWGDEDLPPPLPLEPAPTTTTNALSVIVMDQGNSPKSIDIDNLDALSNVSTSPTPLFAYPASGGASLYPTDSSGAAGGANLYENLKYATINTIVEELETVEENEDELYDEFVVQDSHAVAVEKTRARQPLPPPVLKSYEGGAAAAAGWEEDDVFEPTNSASRRRQVQSVCHSGIDALQQYLHQDYHSQGHGGGGGGAINRLGHSAAINQLHALLQNDGK